MKKFQTRRGITFLELMISLPTATVLIGALAACITISIRAKSQDESIFGTTYDVANAANQIATDLETATAVIGSSTSHIEFVVPDRDGDNLPEQMRYEWGGTSGPNANKILWKYNSNASSVLFEDIGDFSLQTHTSSTPVPVDNHLLSETAILKSVNAFPDGVFREHVINATNQIGQYFIPDVTGSGTKWDLGSIRIMVRAADSNLDGILCVRIMSCDATNLPIAPILAEVKIAESSLGTNYRWLEIPIGSVSWRDQGTPVCITLSHGGGTGDVARVQSVENGSGMPANTNRVSSSNGGATWTATLSSFGLRFYANGIYHGYTGQRTFLTSVGLRIGSARNASSVVETSARLVVTPEVP